MSRARILVLHPALGPLDYRVPAGMEVEPGSIVVVPIGPRQYAGVVWEPERLPTEEIGDNRLRNIIAAPTRRRSRHRCAGSSNGPRTII
jgi:primosomal protein N' (replication factor Y)